LKNNTSQSKEFDDEELFIGTARSESLEMYLKAIWHIAERGNEVKVSSIAKLLNIKQPSVVNMLHKLNDEDFVDYSKANISIRITPKGRQIARKMIRNTRLLEILMKDSLRIDIDEEMVCGIEHHMKEVFTDALCTLLKHPIQCPHGHLIPPGKCCKSVGLATGEYS
jgi:DtxR family Mn-dependent transcriptional regulator